MPTTVDQVKSKAQRILTDRYGSVRIDQDGDFVVSNGSAVSFIKFAQYGDDSVVIQIKCPMLKDVPMSPELCRWIAVEGQHYWFGGCSLNPSADGATAWVYFKHSILGDDLDESELMRSVAAVVVVSDQLDNELQAKFGGTLFGSE